MSKNLEKLMAIVETQMELLEEAQETVKQCANRGEEMFDEIMDLNKAAVELLGQAFVISSLSMENGPMMFDLTRISNVEKGDAEE